MDERHIEVDVITAKNEQQVAENEPMTERELGFTPEVISAPEPKPEKKIEKDEAGLTPDNPIKLKNPVLINGQQRKELTWDEDISSDQFLEADSRAHGARASLTMAEMDNGFHFWLGAMMICAANPEIDPKDLEQVKGRDVASLMRVGRFFLQPLSEED